MYIKVAQLKNGRWIWYIKSANGATVARPPNTYARKWTANRAIRNLLHEFGYCLGDKHG